MPVSSSSSQRRTPSSSCMACSLLAPWKRALARLLRVPAAAALSVRAFRFRNLRRAAARMSPQRRRRRRRRTFRSVRAVFWPLVPPPSSSTTQLVTSAGDDGGEDAGGAAAPETAAPAETTSVHAPLPSPETPAYVKMVARLRSGRSAAAGGGDEEKVEKETACRSFESCLMEMLVEEGKARDLQDVEELLRCWERLKSPVFVDLVCRFYGELCNDLFPVAEGDDTDRDGAGGDASMSTVAA
ncbi:hypothetical protein ACP4OV_016177 [Aristida adscensionis]